jgi:dynein heavy chain
VYSAQYNSIKTLSDKINNGLVKLETAVKDVAKMQVEVKETEIVLQEVSPKPAVLLQEITIGTATAEKTKTEVQIVTDMAGKKATVFGGEKTDVEKDLLSVNPVLDVAESALDAIRASDIKDMTELGKTPEVIKVIFDTVLILKQSPVLKCQMPDIKDIPMYVTKLFRDTDMSELHDG